MTHRADTVGNRRAAMWLLLLRSRVHDLLARLRAALLRLRARGTAVVDDRGRPRLVYHGTARSFSGFDVEAQDADTLHGAGFYFTEERDVARGYSFTLEIPPIHVFATEAELETFTAENPEAQLVYRDEQGGKIVAEFNTPGYRPAVVSAFLRIRHPVDLDALARPDLAAAFLALTGGAAPQTNAELIERLRAHCAAGAANAIAGQHAAQVFLMENGFDGLTELDARQANPHRIWIVFEPSQILELERELVNPPAQ